jgi:hypothetical protein
MEVHNRIELNGVDVHVLGNFRRDVGSIDRYLICCCSAIANLKGVVVATLILSPTRCAAFNIGEEY